MQHIALPFQKDSNYQLLATYYYLLTTDCNLFLSSASNSTKNEIIHLKTYNYDGFYYGSAYYGNYHTGNL